MAIRIYLGELRALSGPWPASTTRCRRRKFSKGWATHTYVNAMANSSVGFKISSIDSHIVLEFFYCMKASIVCLTSVKQLKESSYR